MIENSKNNNDSSFDILLVRTKKQSNPRKFLELVNREEGISWNNRLLIVE